MGKKKIRTQTYIEGRPCEAIGHLQAKERGPDETNPIDTLDLGLLASRIMRK